VLIPYFTPVTAMIKVEVINELIGLAHPIEVIRSDQAIA
jgi:hypothetical protein